MMKNKHTHSYRFIPVFNHIFDPTDKYFLLRVTMSILLLVIGGFGWIVFMEQYNYRWVPGYEWLNSIPFALAVFILIPALVQGRRQKAWFVLTILASIGLTLLGGAMFLIASIFPPELIRKQIFEFENHNYQLWVEDRGFLDADYVYWIYEEQAVIPVLLCPRYHGKDDIDSVHTRTDTIFLEKEGGPIRLTAEDLK